MIDPAKFRTTATTIDVLQLIIARGGLLDTNGSSKIHIDGAFQQHGGNGVSHEAFPEHGVRGGHVGFARAADVFPS